MFSIFAGTSPGQVKEVVDLSIKEMSDVVTNGVTAAELDLAKQQSFSSILLSLEDSASRAAAIAQSEMVHGRQILVEETMAKIAEVTLEEIQNVARDHFKTERIAFAALGDLKGLTIKRDDLQL
jgi:predicted Zn-dependent peptidase